MTMRRRQGRACFILGASSFLLCGGLWWLCWTSCDTNSTADGAFIGWRCALDGTWRWFGERLPSPDEVSGWTERERDERLFRLSRWEDFASAAQFAQFVERQIAGVQPAGAFRFLEAGVGVGAFARHVLRRFPRAHGSGFDREPAVVALAARVLPAERFSLYVVDLTDVKWPPRSFDYVFAPGALCYLRSMAEVRAAVAALADAVRPGGGLCVSMLANATSPMGSCNVRIAERFWMHECALAFGLRVVRLERMDDWGLPHASGRYATCLRK